MTGTTVFSSDKADTAMAQMNSLGAAGIPFLCVVDFTMQNPFVLPLREIIPDELLYDFNGKTNITGTYSFARVDFRKHPVPFVEYKRKYTNVLNNIRDGNSYLLNLTFQTPVSINCSLRDIALRSMAKYRIWYKDRFVVFSPEVFVTMGDGRISSFPMKGTIDASIPEAEQKILADEKETAEHITIVDLIRNDLSMVAQNVEVDKFRFVELVKTNQKDLLQVSSRISGDLPVDYAARIGDILFALLPAGSVTGAPKKKTVEIILETENYERGFYTGVAGIFDGSGFDSCVLIRYIEKTETGYVFKSGGGITCFSDAEKEYAEMMQKVYLPFM
jgi:para-aminobenzoate synthetase component I